MPPVLRLVSPPAIEDVGFALDSIVELKDFYQRSSEIQPILFIQEVGRGTLVLDEVELALLLGTIDAASFEGYQEVHC